MKFRSVFQSDEKTRNEIRSSKPFFKVKRKRKTKSKIQTCENEKRNSYPFFKMMRKRNSYPFFKVMQKRKKKYEVQNRFSKLSENEKQKAKFKPVFQCHAKTKNVDGI